MDEIIIQIDGFYNNSFYYWDTDSMCKDKKYWSNLVDNGFVGKSLGVSTNGYGSSSILYGWSFAQKIKYCLVIDDFGVISAKPTFEGYSEEHRKVKLDEFISLSEGKTV